MNELPHLAARRELGRTGFPASVLGIGDLADRSVPLERCVATVCRAIDVGLNIIDTAPGYEDGYSEQIVGTAVRGMRDRMFVIDKIDDLNDPVMPQLDASLERLGMDHVDAFVFHNLSDLSVFEALTEPGGRLRPAHGVRPGGKGALPRDRFAQPGCAERRPSGRRL